MDKTKSAIRCVGLALLFAGISTLGGDMKPTAGVAATAGAIQWHAYEKGVEKAKSLNKKAIISFYADWCRYCKEMDQKTFAHPSVTAYIKDHFVAIKVNSDLQSDIASAYRITGLPSTWFVDEKGDNISSLPGYIPPDLFIDLLEYIQTDGFKQMSFKMFLKKR